MPIHTIAKLALALILVAPTQLEAETGAEYDFVPPTNFDDGTQEISADEANQSTEASPEEPIDGPLCAEIPAEERDGYEVSIEPISIDPALEAILKGITTGAPVSIGAMDGVRKVNYIKAINRYLTVYPTAFCRYRNTDNVPKTYKDCINHPDNNDSIFRAIHFDGDIYLFRYTVGNRKPDGTWDKKFVLAGKIPGSLWPEMTNGEERVWHYLNIKLWDPARIAEYRNDVEIAHALFHVLPCYGGVTDIVENGFSFSAIGSIGLDLASCAVGCSAGKAATKFKIAITNKVASVSAVAVVAGNSVRLWNLEITDDKGQLSLAKLAEGVLILTETGFAMVRLKQISNLQAKDISCTPVACTPNQADFPLDLVCDGNSPRSFLEHVPQYKSKEPKGDHLVILARDSRVGPSNMYDDTPFRGIYEDELTEAMERWLGPDYLKVEDGKWRSRDGLRQLRKVESDELGMHNIGVKKDACGNVVDAGYPWSHVHFEKTRWTPSNNLKTYFNLHVPLVRRGGPEGWFQ